jgi:predicted nucleic acid-binding protein
MSEPPLVLETSTLINLAASDEMSPIIQSLGRQVIVCAASRTECRWRGENEGPLVQANLDDLARMSVLIDGTELSDAEEALFVELATALADAEAMAVAVATSQGCALASDDAKVRRLFRERVSSRERLLSTPDVVRHWVDSDGISRERARAAVGRMVERAHFEPQMDNEAIGWWKDLVA